MTQKRSNFLMQGSILAAAGIVSRIIGLLFRIPMLAVSGEDGMGVYSTAYSIYNILLFISSYSLPMAVSRIIAQKLSLKQYQNVRRTFLLSLGFGTSLGLVSALIMVFGAKFFAVTVMKMPEAYYAMLALAPAVFFMGMLGVMRGFFQGHGTMVPTAVSQILEQILHVAISLLAGYALFNKGLALDVDGSRYFASGYGAMGATIGTGVGALAALLFLVFIYMMYRRTLLARCERDRSGVIDTDSELLRLIILTALPILVSATMSNIGNVIDQALYAGNVGEGYKQVWGVYTSKYTVLINVPIAIASAISASTLPTVAASITRGELADAREKASRAIRFICLIALPASVGLGVLGKPCFDLLFRSTDNTLAGQMMVWGSLAVLTFSLSTVSVGILQGSGHYWIPIKNYLISLAVHIPLLLFSLYILKGGIIAVVVNHLLYSLFSCILNIYDLSRLFDYRQEYKKTLLLVGAASVIMGLASFGAYKGLYKLHLGNTLSLIIAIALAVLVYFVAAVVLGAVDGDDLAALPKGRYLVKAARKLHLLREEE